MNLLRRMPSAMMTRTPNPVIKPTPESPDRSYQRAINSLDIVPPKDFGQPLLNIESRSRPFGSVGAWNVAPRADGTSGPHVHGASPSSSPEDGGVSQGKPAPDGRPIRQLRACALRNSSTDASTESGPDGSWSPDPVFQRLIRDIRIPVTWPSSPGNHPAP